MRRILEVSLIEWPEGRDFGGPRLLGRTTEPEIIAIVQALNWQPNDVNNSSAFIQRKSPDTPSGIMGIGICV